VTICATMRHGSSVYHTSGPASRLKVIYNESPARREIFAVPFNQCKGHLIHRGVNPQLLFFAVTGCNGII
jgi:hypothetical protein